MAKLISVFLVLVMPTLAAAAPCDFDGDGKSEVSVVQIDDNKRLRWVTHNEIEEEELSPRFGRLGIHIAAADYLGNARSELGYIKSDGTWVIQTDSLQKFTHGAAKATYLAGADIDADGRADALYHDNRCKAQRVTLHALTDPLSTSNRNNYSVRGGRGNLISTYADINGDGTDELCWLKPLRKNREFDGRFRLLCRDILHNTRIPSFVIRKVQDRPLPLHMGTGQADALVLIRKLNNKAVIRIKSAEGKLLARRVVLNGSGPILIGNYLHTEDPQQVAIAQDTRLEVYDLSTKRVVTVPAPDGIKFDEINITHFDDNLDNCLCTTKTVRQNGRCIVNANGCAVKRSLSDGPGGWLHKPVSDNTGSIVNLFPAHEDPSDCRYLNPQGEVIQDAHYTGRSNPNRPTWRPAAGGRCSSFPPNTVVSCIINGQRNCWTIPDPCQRYD